MKILTGKVVSTKMNKTIVVEVVRQTKHPLYKKIIKKSKRYKVHQSGQDLELGDIVKIGPVKPISKEKHFKVLEKI